MSDSSIQKFVGTNLPGVIDRPAYSDITMNVVKYVTLLEAVRNFIVLYEDHHDEPEVLAINMGLLIKERLEPKFGELMK